MTTPGNNTDYAPRKAPNCRQTPIRQLTVSATWQNGLDNLVPVTVVAGAREWFKTHLPAELATAGGSCLGAVWQRSASKRRLPEEAVASMAAVGEINLNATRERWPAVIRMLRQLSPVLPEVGLTTSSLSGLGGVGDSEDAPNIFG